ncbi:MAG TPA: DNA methyltransferase, partial [Chloroflexia bacterium]
MKAFEAYLQRLGIIKSSRGGGDEAPYYAALDILFNTVGQGLKPKVVFIQSLKNKGAGIPDGGFFTVTQLRKNEDVDWQTGQPPERGAIEVKGTGDDVERIAGGEQVTKYLKRYGLVLVTNLRDFLLVGQDEHGRAVNLERYTLGADEKSFWTTVMVSPQRMVTEHGIPFTEYLTRVMLYKAPLSSPSDLAWFLASYAKDANGRVELAAKVGLPALRNVRTSLESALGLTFEGEKGDHFFRSTLVQTLFYGMFSAWVLWSKKRSPSSDDWFDWKDAGWELQVPIIRSL